LLRRHTLVTKKRQKDSRTSKEGPHTPRKKSDQDPFPGTTKVDYTRLDGSVSHSWNALYANPKLYSKHKTLHFVVLQNFFEEYHCCPWPSLSLENAFLQVNKLANAHTLSLRAHTEFLNLSQNQQHYPGI
jgi:hypothetical protein